MKSILRSAAAIAVAGSLLALGACTAAQQATATADLAKVQTAVVQGCEVIQPTLQSIAALDPSAGAVATANGLFCATASSITITSVQSVLTTGIPAIEQAITASTLIPSNQKLILTAAIGIGQVTIQNALTVFNNATAATAAAAVPASTSAAAPVAASQ